ncbi:MAG TPA: enoyl-CoA hydratase-related protein, partial [Acidimicrobiales bacterium]|nr:enoyl-CoA hydratase-related protein [Acidimicrobiales bacterium]
LNRPEAANSLSPELLAALADAFAEIRADDGVRVVVLTGAGEKVFCAGMDLKAFSEQGEGGGRGGDGRRGAGFTFTREGFEKPVVAAVNGAAVGGGFELVLGCDLVVAAEHARFGLPEVKRGLLPAGGGTLLGTRIPLPMALEVALTGEYVDAARAASWGLVNRVVPAAGLLSAALELAGLVAANGPIAVQVTKRLTRDAVLVDPARGWASPEDVAAVFGSEDAKEGARAFVEKRAPTWVGR